MKIAQMISELRNEGVKGSTDNVALVEFPFEDNSQQSKSNLISEYPNDFNKKNIQNNIPI